ncbi:Xaa-Pro aminopeptidase [Neolewinella xylanilytica]|uniref:Xaa-Pro aminopeptidase n=1 Tax=Neolewinella xylanilytica TaxID=1514080 RepID=A0A2S6I7K2_9BACT|nr:aminopeptidase P family protein [Neolewinella xylanilytica]PPK87481.1 Xaa-Pro aminopeptidase [Neolewinella xylanilytica]
MFSATTYTERRRQLANALSSGLILLPANGEAALNYRGNTYPFRQDSHFRYFAGYNLPDLVLTIDVASGEGRLYGNDFTLDDVVWMGEQPDVADLAKDGGLSYGGTLDRLAAALSQSGEVHYLPPYREERRQQLRDWLGHCDRPSVPLIRAVVELRSVKSREEVAEMDKAVATSMRMHAAARDTAMAGMTEASVAGLIEGIAISAGGRLAYPAIVTRNGHILHNHYHGNQLRRNDLLLVDAGAETDTGYAGDITRTFPIGGVLTDRQRPVYETVERAKSQCIQALRPGVAFREIHDLSARIITEGLKDLGLMKGDAGEAVAAGAHALFYPHGLGHMIGLDVHDMEDLGEDYVGYDDTIRRSELFGTRNLRLGRALREGFTVTVEPGIYFIPKLIDRWEADGKHREFINYDALEGYRNFGGIRLEDNVVVTSDNCRVLGSV